MEDNTKSQKLSTSDMVRVWMHMLNMLNTVGQLLDAEAVSSRSISKALSLNFCGVPMCESFFI